jgi:NTP pyrophosphatase (non-canonical NTP hydrolase)
MLNYASLSKGEIIFLPWRIFSNDCKGLPFFAGPGNLGGMTDKPSLEYLTARLLAFRDERDWKKFHSLKNLLLSLSLEAAELLELAQWQTDEELEARLHEPGIQARLREECADIFLYLLLIAERVGFDLPEAGAAKIERNAAKYPVEKARGSAKKYTEL